MQIGQNNKPYKLMQAKNPEPTCRKTMRIHDQQIELLYYDVLDSTMSVSATYDTQLLAENHGIAFLASQQTSGQGQRDNKWISPKGNVYMTYLRKVNMEELRRLTSLVGLAIYDTINPYIEDKSQIKLKWVNDVFVGDKKISGILIRTDSTEEPGYFYAQIGVGVNYLVAPMQNSTCLKEHVKLQLPPVQSFVEALLKNIEHVLDQNKKLGFPRFKENLLEKLAFKGQHVYILSIDLKSVLEEGEFLGIDDYCFALLKDKSGKVKTIDSGRMRKDKS